MTRASVLMHWFRFKADTLSMVAFTDVVLEEQLLAKILKRYTQLNTSFKLQHQRQDAMMRVEEEELPADTSFVKELLHSKEAKRRLLSTLRRAKKGQDIALGDYKFYLRYVTAVITYTNAQRTGAVLNMRLKEYRRARKKGAVEGGLPIRVWHHKTVESHSCADVFIGAEVIGLIDDYLHWAAPDNGVP